MALTDKQIKLLAHYSKKAGVSLEQVIERVEKGKCTINEITQVLLGIKVG